LLLQVVYLALSNATRRQAVLNRNGSCSTNSLTKQGAGRHNTSAAHCRMGSAYVLSCKKQIVDVGGIKAPVRNSIRRQSLILLVNMKMHLSEI
jgi:hypothetical protein